MTLHTRIQKLHSMGYTVREIHDIMPKVSLAAIEDAIIQYNTKQYQLAG